MFAAGVGEQNAPGKSELTAPRVGPHLAARGGDRNLQPPAAAEKSHAGIKHGLGEFDLVRHCRAAVIDVERRSGHRDAVVALQPDSRRNRRAIRGGHDVDAE